MGKTKKIVKAIRCGARKRKCVRDRVNLLYFILASLWIYPGSKCKTGGGFVYVMSHDVRHHDVRHHDTAGGRLPVLAYAVARFLHRLPEARVNGDVAEYHVGQNHVKRFNRIPVVFVPVNDEFLVIVRKECLRQVS